MGFRGRGADSHRTHDAKMLRDDYGLSYDAVEGDYSHVSHGMRRLPHVAFGHQLTQLNGLGCRKPA